MGDGAGGGAFAQATRAAGDEGDGREVIHVGGLCGAVMACGGGTSAGFLRFRGFPRLDY